MGGGIHGGIGPVAACEGIGNFAVVAAAGTGSGAVTGTTALEAAASATAFTFCFGATADG